MDYHVYDIGVLALRTFVLIGLPVVLVLSICSTLVSLLQAATSIHDVSLSYAVRLLALCALLYALYPSFAELLRNLAEKAFL